MSDAGTQDREPEGDDIVAAEYVLGLQTAEERTAAQRRIDASREFAARVDRWEAHFAPLAASFEEVEPPAGVKQRIDRALFTSAASNAKERPGIWSSLAVWRTLAIGALAALVAFVALPQLQPSPQQEGHRMVASLSAEGSDVHFMAMVDHDTNSISLSHVSGQRAAGRDFELWMIEGQNPPVSLGVIPQGETFRMQMPAPLAEHVNRGNVFAISLEPTGGSPTGQPTGPVVAAGGLTEI
ncbi:anti-sigma factor [Tianweitania sediminis]|uniref:Anti-sigma factor n=1 Tax=Tianweitania sediminis TaxID=1502156 RepID=A0A8J7UJ49_9HYPH|nr:anti-sigma factor [Tianweitania sediminis]MBP0438495.1 anti-sigma factor [Tianweitania sediminis]